MSFSFKTLSLKNIEAKSAATVLKSGRHLVTVRESEVVQTKAKTGYMLVLRLSSEDGVITDRINVENANKEAERIGLSQLKGMLECAGHPTPDEPGDVASLKGLKVGIIVGQEGMHEGQPSFKVKSYCKPEDVSGAAATKPVAPNGDIPF